VYLDHTRAVINTPILEEFERGEDFTASIICEPSEASTPACPVRCTVRRRPGAASRRHHLLCGEEA